MEELHAAALAYYAHANLEQKHLAWSFFQSMDRNKDNRVSCSEFTKFLEQSSYRWVISNDPTLFTKLDRNSDGCLDFEEVLTFYYIIKTRSICCRTCHVPLYGLYFTCVACFDGADRDPYDLCPVCYRTRNFVHHHPYFLDNHVLLRSKRGLPAFAAPNLNLAITAAPQTPPINHITYYNCNNNNHYVSAVPQTTNTWASWFHGFDIALTAATLASNCAIM